jgi:glycosyl transferase family 25
MDNIDKVIYINLGRRTDRRTHIEHVLAEYDIVAERFEAIEHANGLYGCGMSHLAVLKMARDNSWKNVLILEDDIQFELSSHQFNESIRRFFSEEEGPGTFDVCMLDINLQRSEPVKQDWLERVLYAHCAGAYIVQSHYYQKLIDLYEWALPLLLDTGMHWIYANDAVWGRLQETDRWYTFKHFRVCKQMPGYSDTKNMII